MDDLNIDESSHKSIPSMGKRLWNAFFAIVLGIVLVQMIFWVYGIHLGSSVLLLFDNPLFLLFLGGCGVFGWLSGQRFHGWLYKEIGFWKFW